MTILLIFFLLVSSISAQEQIPPRAEKIDEGIYRIGKVTLNRNEGNLQFPAKVNMKEGLVEYLAVSRNGKLHESVLVVEAQPLDIQLGLLLLGLNYGGGLEYQGDKKAPKGDKVEIWVKWKENRKERKVRGEDLIYNQLTRKSMTYTHWVFTGSQIIEKEFMAQIEGSIVATYRDPFAILNNPLECGVDDTILYANSEMLPAAGTSVVVLIRPAEGAVEKSTGTK